MHEAETRRIELSPPKEIFVPDFKGLTISGPSGGGKTEGMELLSDEYGIERTYKAGLNMRERTDVFSKRDKKHDLDIDATQREIIRSANPKEPFIIEGRLAGVLATEEMQENPDLNIVRILFVAPSEIRMRRILKRHRSKNVKDLAELERQLQEAYEAHSPAEDILSILENINILKSEKFSLKTVKHEERRRETEDLVHWRKIHPQLKNVEPFNPAFAHFVFNPGKSGKEQVVENKTSGIMLYDFSINTGGISVADTVREINKRLIEMGKVKVVKNVEKLPRQGILYTS